MNKLSDQHVSAFVAAFPTVKERELMSSHTYLKIGGPARLYLVAASADEVVAAVERAIALEIPWAVIGGGSNLLVNDDGYEGLVIQAADRTVVIEDESVTAGAGVFSVALARQTAEVGLTGFEWAASLPGTIGGAVVGNAGCFGGEMKDAVVSVEVWDAATRSRKIVSNAECGFGYRESRFKHEAWIVLRVTLKLQRDTAGAARAKMEEIAAKRKDAQPTGVFTAGCMFKNFDFTTESDLEKLRREGDEIPPAMLQQKRIAAGWLIDKLALKGKTIGKAQVSPVHGNFLVNLGGATAQDVIALSSYVKMKVRDELGILLEDEVRYLGF